MSHCGPLTAKVLRSKTSLRICTPLFPDHPLPVSLTWNVNSKSLYIFLLHRKVLKLMPSGNVDPVSVPSLTDQNFSRPSHPDMSLPLKNASFPVWPVGRTLEHQNPQTTNATRTAAT